MSRTLGLHNHSWFWDCDHIEPEYVSHLTSTVERSIRKQLEERGYTVESVKVHSLETLKPEPVTEKPGDNPTCWRYVAKFDTVVVG